MLDWLHGLIAFFKIDLKRLLTLDQNMTWRWEEDNIQDKEGIGWMICDIISAEQFPGIFMKLMNRLLKHFICKIIVVYFDEILIYNCYEDNHVIHLSKKKLIILQKNKLDGNLKSEALCPTNYYS